MVKGIDCCSNVDTWMVHTLVHRLGLCHKCPRKWYQHLRPHVHHTKGNMHASIRTVVSHRWYVILCSQLYMLLYVQNQVAHSRKGEAYKCSSMKIVLTC